MGIDGIGGGGGPPKVGGDGMAPGGAGSARRTGAEFSLERDRGVETNSAADAAGGKSDVAGSDADLGALQRGELSRDQYLERRVDSAVSHLQGVLGPDQMQLLREQLREQLDADPVLRRLVQRATGSGEADDEG